MLILRPVWCILFSKVNVFIQLYSCNKRFFTMHVWIEKKQHIMLKILLIQLFRQSGRSSIQFFDKYRGRILERNPDKSMRCFSLCYSLFAITQHCKDEKRKTLQKTIPPSLLFRKSIQKPQVCYSQDYAQKPQWIVLSWIRLQQGIHMHAYCIYVLNFPVPYIEWSLYILYMIRPLILDREKWWELELPYLS